MRNAHKARHSVAWFVAGADGTVLGEIASGNIQTVYAFPTDLIATKSFAGTGLEAADTRIGAHRVAAQFDLLDRRGFSPQRLNSLQRLSPTTDQGLRRQTPLSDSRILLRGLEQVARTDSTSRP